MRILRRFTESSGQGLVEILVVLTLLGTLVAVATPLYMGFQDRRANKAAQSHLVVGVQAAEAYRLSHGSYVGMNALDLYRIDPRLSASLTVASAHRRSYCLTDTVSGRAWSIAGPVKGRYEFTSNTSCE